MVRNQNVFLVKCNGTLTKNREGIFDRIGRLLFVQSMWVNNLDLAESGIAHAQRADGLSETTCFQGLTVLS